MNAAAVIRRSTIQYNKRSHMLL